MRLQAKALWDILQHAATIRQNSNLPREVSDNAYIEVHGDDSVMVELKYDKVSHTDDYANHTYTWRLWFSAVSPKPIPYYIGYQRDSRLTWKQGELNREGGLPREHR